MQRDQISIKLNKEELIEVFKQSLAGPNKDLLAHAIFGVAESEAWRLEKIFKAAMGIRSIMKFPIGTELKIHKGEISTWNWDVEEMRQRKLLVDSYVEAKLIEYNEWSSHPYKLQVRVYKDNENGEEWVTENASGDRMVLKEEWPETKKEDDDLPF